MEYLSDFIGAFLRPFFWLTILSLVYWLASFLPERVQRVLFFRLWD